MYFNIDHHICQYYPLLLSLEKEKLERSSLGSLFNCGYGFASHMHVGILFTIPNYVDHVDRPDITDHLWKWTLGFMPTIFVT